MPSISAYNGVRVLVLGASGFIGRRVARMLSSEGADLHAAVRDSASLTGESFNRCHIAELDLLDSGALTGLIREIAPDIVFNLAGYGINPAERDQALAEAINAGLLTGLAEAVSRLPATRWQGTRIVHAGSALEYGICSGDLSETTEAKPTTLYGRSKLAGTLALQHSSAMHGISSITVRLFTVYGPGERAGRLLPSLLAIARNGGVLELTPGLQQRDFTYLEDVVEGLLRLGTIHTPPGEIVNLATGQLTSVREFAETAAMVLGIPPENLHFGAIPVREEEMAHWPVTTVKLQKMLRWLPTTTIAQGIQNTVLQANQPDVEMH